MPKRFLTRIREDKGVLRAEALDADDTSRGALAAIAFVASESGTMAAQHLVPLIPEPRSRRVPPESGVHLTATVEEAPDTEREPTAQKSRGG